MPSFKSMLSYAACVAVAQAHSQLLNIQGEAGTPASVAFKVDPSLARNCTTINPCQQDATIIRDAEIKANIVNECGRTELEGNIDIGENTENALAANAVTGVKPGTEMTVTVHQVNADGAGPYVCDLVEQGNTGVITQNLTVKNNVPGANGFSQEKFKDFNMTVVMPEKFDCTGASTGNVCTVRCRNNAQAGPFGGCFPVQQVGKKAQDFTPQSIPTKSTLEAVSDQVAQDQKDLKAAEQANANAGTDEAKANAAAVASRVSVSAGNFPTQTPEVKLGGNGNAAGNNNNNNNGGNNNNNNGGNRGGNNNNNNNGGNNGANRGGNNNNNGGNGGNNRANAGGNGGNNGFGGGFGGRQNKKVKREQLRARSLE